MKNILIIMVLSIVPLLEVYSQFTPKLEGHYSQRNFSEKRSDYYTYRFRESNRIEFTDSLNGISKSGAYNIIHDNNVPFLHIYWNDNTTVQYLMLMCEDFICLYEDNSEPVFWGLYYRKDGDFSDWEWSWIEPLFNILASSTLKEGNTLYEETPERLGLHINRVWAVEGGIGEHLHISWNNPHNGNLRFYISTGYVHFSRPYLFMENSRPRKIRFIDWYNGEILHEQELEDTPNFQIIDLINGNFEVNIEIIEIYPGTKFDHTCINSIMMLVHEWAN